jgi:hypothetical protein
MARICLYTRISTDEENQPTSLASQHERLEAFCKVQEDWRIVAHHEDRATGTKLDRPGLQAALDLARQGRIDQLLVYRIDRLSRKVRQLASIADRLENVLALGEPEQTKALLRILIAELRVNSKTDIQPTYRIITPDRTHTAGVCATSEKCRGPYVAQTPQSCEHGR